MGTFPLQGPLPLWPFTENQRQNRHSGTGQKPGSIAENPPPRQASPCWDRVRIAPYVYPVALIHVNFHRHSCCQVLVAALVRGPAAIKPTLSFRYVAD